MGYREIDEQIEHDHVVAVLHKRFYNYPNPNHPHLMTFVNHPCKKKAVLGPNHAELFPDVVVFDTETSKLVMVAEVETASTVDDAEAREWEEFSRLGARFYLYVPRGCGARAAQLCQGFKLTELVQYAKLEGQYLLERYR